MFENFIMFEPRAQRPPSPQVPGLLFVNCNHNGGRTQERVKPRLRRHVMRTHLHRDRKSRLRSEPESESDPRATLGDSSGTLSLTFDPGYDAKTILQWLAAGHDSMQAEKFQTARRLYLHELWEWASAQKLFVPFKHSSGAFNCTEAAFDGLAVLVCRKKLNLAGHRACYRREYLQRKGGLIKAIQQGLIRNESSTSSAMVFAICALASCSVRESELLTGTAHLVAVKSMWPKNYDSLVCWAYVWLVDLRLALLASARPILEYDIPQEFNELHLQHRPVQPVRPDAVRLASLCPSMKTTFDSPRVEGLFSRLLGLCSVSESLEAAATLPRVEGLFSRLLDLCSVTENLGATATLPLFLLYEIEYELRVVHASVLDNAPSPTRVCIELVVVAVQLSVWIAARFFAPLTEQAESTVLRRANHLLGSVSPIELLQTWTSSAQAEAVSLLWVLAIFTSCSLADSEVMVGFPELAYVTDYLCIESEREFLRALQQWPPQKTWNGSQYSVVWAKLTKFKVESLDLEMSHTAWQEPIARGEQAMSEARRPSFGAIELWDV